MNLFRSEKMTVQYTYNREDVDSYPSGHVIYMNDLLRAIMMVISKANCHFESVRIASAKDNVKIFGYQNIKHSYLKKIHFR
jgi:hypothetical protein